MRGDAPSTLPFVVQEHRDETGVHWDLMLRRVGEFTEPDPKILATWKLPLPPTPENLSHPLAARALPNHRLSYLTYEGPISRGRGSCTIFDRGTYRIREICEELWRFCLAGERVKGKFTLKKIADPDRWQLERDVSGN